MGIFIHTVSIWNEAESVRWWNNIGQQFFASSFFSTSDLLIVYLIQEKNQVDWTESNIKWRAINGLFVKRAWIKFLLCYSFLTSKIMLIKMLGLGWKFSYQIHSQHFSGVVRSSTKITHSSSWPTIAILLKNEAESVNLPTLEEIHFIVAQAQNRACVLSCIFPQLIL